MSFRSLPRASFTVSRNYTYSFIYSPPQGKNVWLLFLHGFPSTAYDWRHQIPFFINLGYGVVAPDLLGYGQSPKPAELEAYKAKAMSADIIEILKSKNITKVIGVAHDLGVLLLSRLENYYSQYFLGHVFLSAPYQMPVTHFDLAGINSFTESSFGFPVFGYWPFFDSKDTGDILSEKDASFQSLFYPENPEIWYSDLCTRDGARLWIQQGKVTPPAKYITAEEAKEHERLFAIENGGYQPALYWYKSMIHNINADDERKANLSADTLIKVPVLYIRGSRDPLASGNPENEFKKLAINFSFEVFEGGHWPALEKRVWLNERLGQFFASLRD